MQVKKDFLSIGHWIDKAMGVPKSSLAPINQGIGKTSNKPYAMIDTENTETVDGTYPLGSIVNATLTLNDSTPQATPDKAPEQRNLKISTQQ